MKAKFRELCQRCRKRQRATKYGRYCEQCRKLSQERKSVDKYGAKASVDLSETDATCKYRFLQDIINPEKLIREIEKILEKIYLTKTNS